jgi:Protein of unknown function (DUF2510)
MALTAPPAGWYHHRLDPEVLQFWDGNGWTEQRRRVPPPGWYPHPQDPHLHRHWNGSAWTDDVAPASAAQPPAAATTVASAPGPSAPAAPPPAAPAPPPPEPPPVAPPSVAAASDAAPATPTGREGPAEAVARLRAAPIAPPVERDTVASVEPAQGSSARRRRSPFLLAVEAVALVAVVVAGGYLALTKSGLNLGGSPIPPAVAAPAGYHTVTLSSAGLSFAAPGTWLGLDTSSPTFQQNLQAFMAAHPTLCSGCAGTSGVAAATSNIKYVAADTSNPTYQSNIEVVSLGVTRDALTNPVATQDAMRREIPNAVVAPATIAGARGLSLTGTIDVTLPTESHLTVYVTGYIVGTSSGVYWINFNTADPGSHDAVVQTALHTLRLAS